LKNSDLARTQNSSCPLNCIAHLRHEGIAADAENLAQEPRSAFAPASNEIAPLQIQFGENQTQRRERVFQQYRRTPDIPEIRRIGSPAIPHHSAENPLRIKRRAKINPTGFEWVYTARMVSSGEQLDPLFKPMTERCNRA